MRQRVRLADDVTVLQREAHRNALLTLPLSWELVDSNEDYLVSRPGSAIGTITPVTTAVPRTLSARAPRIPLVVEYDRVVQDFVDMVIPHRKALAGIQITEWLSDDALTSSDEADRVVNLLLPDHDPGEWHRVVVGPTTIAHLDAGPTRVAVSTTISAPNRPLLEVRLIGAGISAWLTVSTGLSAQPSRAQVTTTAGSVGPRRAYSSAFRNMWIALAGETE